MSEITVRLEEAKKKFDKQDLIDIVDQFVREAEKLEEENKKLEAEKDEWIALLDANRRKIIELEQGNQKNIEEVESLHKIIIGIYKENSKLRLESMWKDGEWGGQGVE